MFKKIILLFAVLYVLTVTAAKQEITIKNVTVKTTRYRDATALKITYDVTLLHSIKEMEAGGDTIHWYTISVFFYADTGVLSAATGFNKIADSTGRLIPGHSLSPYTTNKIYPGQQVYIPVAAFNLDEGAHCLRPVFVAQDNWGNEIACKFKSDSLDFTMPPRIKLKLAVSYILVSDTDYRGEPWDDYVFNPKNAKPDVYWTTVLMGEKLNLADYANNSYTYSDPEGRDNFDFTICKGDIIYLKVYDYDILSRDDFIGELKIDMNTYKALDKPVNTKCGLVLDIDYLLAKRYQ